MNRTRSDNLQISLSSVISPCLIEATKILSPPCNGKVKQYWSNSRRITLPIINPWCPKQKWFVLKKKENGVKVNFTNYTFCILFFVSLPFHRKFPYTGGPSYTGLCRRNTLNFCVSAISMSRWEPRKDWKKLVNIKVCPHLSRQLIVNFKNSWLHT